MLSRAAFNFLPLEEKLVYLSQEACRLAHRQTHVFDIKLYYLDNFFVEAYYSLVDGQCDYISSFHGTHWLTPYLDYIQLNLNL